MTIQLEYTYQLSETSGTSKSITGIFDIQAGDLLIFHIMYESGSITSYPDGWRQLGFEIGGVGTYSALFTRTINSQDLSSFGGTWEFSGAAQYSIATLSVIRSSDINDPDNPKIPYHEDVVISQSTGSSHDYNTNLFTKTGRSKSYVLCWSSWTTSATPNSITPDALMVELDEQQGSTDSIIHMMGLNTSTPGAVAQATSTFTDTFTGGSFSLLISETDGTDWSDVSSLHKNNKNLYLLPDEVTGYSLDSPGSFWSVVAPVKRTNYINNPSFEYGSDGYSIAASFYDISERKASRGIKSLMSIAAPNTKIDISYVNSYSDLQDVPIVFSLDVMLQNTLNLPYQ